MERNNHLLRPHPGGTAAATATTTAMRIPQPQPQQGAAAMTGYGGGGSGEKSKNLNLAAPPGYGMETRMLHVASSDDDPPDLVRDDHGSSPGRRSYGEIEDDDEEEEEMVSLERQRQRLMRSQQAAASASQQYSYNNTGNYASNSNHRRGTTTTTTAAATATPTAVRRTPGASAMHRSAVANQNGHSAAAAAVTAAAAVDRTPIMRRTPGAAAMQQHGVAGVGVPPSAVKAMPAAAAAAAAASTATTTTTAGGGRGLPPPTPSSVGRQQPTGPRPVTGPRPPSRPPLYTPAGIALAKNPHINAPAGGRDAFSPATVRLTETLDKLMDDDDEEEEDEKEKEEEEKKSNNIGGAGAGTTTSTTGGPDDALAAAINASPRRRVGGLGDNTSMTNMTDLSLSSSSADPSPVRKAIGLGLDGSGGMLEDWSAVYTFEQDVARRLQEQDSLARELSNVAGGKPTTDGGRSSSGAATSTSIPGGGRSSGPPGFAGRSNSPPRFAGSNGAKMQQQQQQQQQQQLRSGSNAQGNGGYDAEPDGPVSFGAFAPPTSKQSALHTPKPKKAGEEQEPDQKRQEEQLQQQQQQWNQQQGYNNQHQQQYSHMSEPPPDPDMMQLQQQFHQMGQAGPGHPQPPRWMGTQSPHMLMESPVPPPPAIFGFMNDPHHGVMSPMNVPPLPSGIMSPVPMSPHVMSPVTVPMAPMAPSPVTVPVFNGSILPGTMGPPQGQHFGLPPMSGPGLWSTDPSQQQGFGGVWGAVPGGGGILPPPMAPSPVPPHAMSPVPPHAMSPVPPHAIMDPQAGVFHPQMHPGPDYYASQQQQQQQQPGSRRQQEASQRQAQRQQRQLQQQEQQLQEQGPKKVKGVSTSRRAPGVENHVPSRTNSLDEYSSEDINSGGVSSKLQDAARALARDQKTKGQKKGMKGSEDVPDSPKKGKKQQQQDDTASQAQKGSAPATDPGEVKKAELNENPATKLAFKEFYRKFHALERTSLSEAQQFATSVLEGGAEGTPLPGSVHWRVYLELADLAKRSNQSDAARALYGKVCELQPYTPQGWLEYSKLEEECGNLPRCSQLLYKGLSYCDYNESLMTRAIKHEEKTGNLSGARTLLARLKHAPGIEKVWRTVLEGALFEARAGNTIVARRLLKYLMHHVPWYGPLYLEAYKLERDSDQPADALAIVERGLGEIPRYGPLWFGAFRLCEGLDMDEGSYDLPRTMKMVERATSSISRELLWKVHLEAAQAHERAAVMFCEANPDHTLDGNLKLSRTRFARAALACPPNLCWKVWLAGGKMELTAGRYDVARTLFHRASDVVPEKGRSAVFLEFARQEEFVGNMKLARAVLCKARNDASSDWKIWLESVNLEIRCKMPIRAARVACEALKIHTGTGRLWAALVQLRHREGEDAQLRALKQSLRAVPKSGEVWGEGARIHLNPFSPTFDLDRADQHLIFATKFTPQYGDSFLETLRLELLTKWIVPGVQSFIDNMEMRLESPDVVDNRDIYSIVGEYARVAAKALMKDLLLVEDVRKIDTSSLELRCSNADPNYGKLWFRCRTKPADTARNVLVRAKFMIAEDLAKYAHIYVAAILRRKGATFLLKKEYSTNGDVSITEGSVEWDSLLDDRVRNGPTIGDLLTEEDGMALLERAISGADFTTGLFEANKPELLESLSLTERRKLLFGSDLLLSWKSP